MLLLLLQTCPLFSSHLLALFFSLYWDTLFLRLSLRATSPLELCCVCRHNNTARLATVHFFWLLFPFSLALHSLPLKSVGEKMSTRMKNKGQVERKNLMHRIAVDAQCINCVSKSTVSLYRARLSLNWQSFYYNHTHSIGWFAYSKIASGVDDDDTIEKKTWWLACQLQRDAFVLLLPKTTGRGHECLFCFIWAQISDEGISLRPEWHTRRAPCQWEPQISATAGWFVCVSDDVAI